MSLAKIIHNQKFNVILITIGIFYIIVKVLFNNLANADNGDSLIASARISASGMQAQSERLKVISQNIANADVSATAPDGDPYRRKIIFFKNEYDNSKEAEVIKVDKISHDYSDFIMKYQPNHPAADEKGYVKYPNINVVVETIDAKEAQRSFEANVNAFELAKANQSRVLDLLK